MIRKEKIRRYNEEIRNFQIINGTLIRYNGNADELIVPDGVERIVQNSFSFNGSVRNIILPNSVTSIGYSAFANCSGLKSVTIGNSLERIDTAAFDKCNSLTDIYYNGNIAGWCSIVGLYGLMGYGCSAKEKTLYINNKKVTDLVLPSSVTSVGEFAFTRCAGLTSIAMSDSVTSIGRGAFDS